MHRPQGQLISLNILTELSLASFFCWSSSYLCPLFSSMGSNGNTGKFLQTVKISGRTYRRGEEILYKIGNSSFKILFFQKCDGLRNRKELLT